MKYNCVYSMQVKVSVEMDAVNPEVKEIFDDGELDEMGIAEMIARHRLVGLLEHSSVGVDVMSVQPDYTEQEIVKNKYKVICLHEGYQHPLVLISHIEAPTLRNALIQLYEHIQEDEYLPYEQQKYGRELTGTEIIQELQRIDDLSLLSIMNEDTGEEYVQPRKNGPNLIEEFISTEEE